MKTTAEGWNTGPTAGHRLSRLVACLLSLLLLATLPAAVTGAAPVAGDDEGSPVLVQLRLWLDAGLHRLTAGLGGFGGTGDDGMGLDPDGGGGGDESSPPDGSDGTTDDDTSTDSDGGTTSP